MTHYDIKLRIADDDPDGITVCFGSKVLGYVKKNGTDTLKNKQRCSSWNGKNTGPWSLPTAVETILQNHVKDIAKHLAAGFAIDGDLDPYEFKDEDNR